MAAGNLVQVLPQWSFSPVSMFAVSASRLQPAKSRVFIDFLAERLSAK
jgi:LysR family transcriptional regulator, regulator for bpeEF and oprC